ncbi:RNA polymerase sigma factor [Streptomyces syringium]|uniref:RNA polymerase sigma factor n=1 Tax=Streptomyces syringium TaxID=76729 RepID=UPI003AB09B16
MSAQHAVKRAADGENLAAYEAFVRRKRPGYAKWAYSRLLSWEDAREAASDALFKIYLKRHEAFADANTDAFAFKILHDSVVDMLRKRDRRPTVAIGLAFEETVQPIAGIPSDEFEQVLLRLDVHQAVLRLSDRQRTCISLRYVLGCPDQEISDITGLNCSTIRSHLAAGREALAALLHRPDDEKGPRP